MVLEGQAQVNESLITGEERAVPKGGPGRRWRSGSFLVAGHCTARLTRVGAESYASKLTAAAQADGHKVAKGEMMRSLDKLIQAIGLGLVPVGVALFWKQHGVLALDLRSSVEGTVAALIGMIPEGLYLLTSVALAIGMLRLARRRVLTQDMNCIETLAPGGCAVHGQDRHHHRERHGGTGAYPAGGAPPKRPSGRFSIATTVPRSRTTTPGGR